MSIDKVRDYKSSVPEGRSGDWCVKHFTVSAEDERWGKLRAAISFSSGGRYVPVGKYTGLMRKNTMVMSDTPDEVRDHWEPVYRAKERCLVNGLGLGVVLDLILQKSVVSHVTVIEISPDVIRLVAPHLQEKFPGRIEVVNADALTWKPPSKARYGMVWHDIWDNICGDNLPEMKLLHRRYGRRCEWQGSWQRERCER